MEKENYLDRNPELKRLLLRLGTPRVTLTKEELKKELNLLEDCSCMCCSLCEYRSNLEKELSSLKD